MNGTPAPNSSALTPEQRRAACRLGAELAGLVRETPGQQAAPFRRAALAHAMYLLGDEAILVPDVPVLVIKPADDLVDLGGRTGTNRIEQGPS